MLWRLGPRLLGETSPVLCACNYIQAVLLHFCARHRLLPEPFAESWQVEQDEEQEHLESSQSVPRSFPGGDGLRSDRSRSL